MNRRICAIAVGAGISFGCTLVIASPASAHPLGNFSVNHYHGLRVHPDRVDDLAVLDEAEIPTRQEQAGVDTNGDGSISPGEGDAFRAGRCQDIAGGLHATADGRPLTFRVVSSGFSLHPGAAGLPTSRIECQLTAPTDLRRPTKLTITDTYRSDRVGWHEMTAVADGLGFADSSVPATTTSDELRHYPSDLLASPLNQRTANIDTTPGGGVRPGAAPVMTSPGLFGRWLSVFTNRFYALVASPHLSLAVGLLAVALALLLGSAHAALPGHGKTVMAAYIAGRRGTIRDAVTVGAAVTATHTAGVLILGLLLTVMASLVGERILGWLGVASGLLISAIGLGLLRTALRQTALNSVTVRWRARWRRRSPANLGSLVAAQTASQQPIAVSGAATMPGTDLPVRSDEHQDPGHHHRRHDAHRHLPHDMHSSFQDHGHHNDAYHRHGYLTRKHDGHTHQHAHHHDEPRGRRGLVAMGIAGGLVPSPSALVVLLAAIALGRTWFGVLLVLAYGIGMAATLTAAGLTLVVLRQRLATATTHRLRRWSTRLSAATPPLTATLVVIVGLALTVSALAPLLT